MTTVRAQVGNGQATKTTDPGNAQSQIDVLLGESQKSHQSDGAESLKLAHWALDLAEFEQDSMSIGLAHLQMASIFNHYELFQRANHHSKVAMATFTNPLYLHEQANAMMECGTANCRARKWKIAKMQIEEAIQHYIILSDDSKRATGYFKLAVIEYANGNFDSSLEKLVRAKNILERVKDTTYLAKVYGKLAMNYLALGKESLALSQATEAYRAALKANNAFTVRDNLFVLANAHEAAGNQAMAFQFFKEHIKQKDSITYAVQSLDLEHLQMTYESEKGDKNLQASDKKHETLEGQIRSLNLLIILLAAVVAAVVTISVFFFRYKSKSESALREKQVAEVQLVQIKKENKKIMMDAEDAKRQKDILEAQKRQFLKIKEELESKNNELNMFNSNLEEIVSKRTWELIASNQDLKEAYEEVDLFAYRASHDFKGPLKTLEAVVDFAQIDCHDEMAIEHFETIASILNKMNSFLDKLLLVHKVKNHNGIMSLTSESDIANYFKDTLLQRHSAFKLMVSISDKDQMYIDWELLKMAFNEIIENSVFYLNPHKEQPFASLRIEKSSKDTIITITDNGQGIKPLIIPKVFDMFYRGNEFSEGNGLGLYIVSKVMEKMNGQVDISSIERESTTINLRFKNQGFKLAS